MSKMSDPNVKPLHRHLPNKPDTCVACQIKTGTPMYGITLCPECDDEIFVKPYGRRSDPNETLSAISLRITKHHPKFDSLEVFYRFDRWDTLVSGKKGSLSMPVVTLPGIQPMTQEFLDKVVDKLNLWLTFS
jgi:hypothetical protein